MLKMIMMYIENNKRKLVVLRRKKTRRGSSKLCEILSKKFLTEHLWTTASAFGDLKLWKLRIWSHLLKKS